MSRKKLFIKSSLPILLLLMFLPLRAWAADYYVNTATGNNANDGSVTNPWKTITHALNQTTAGDAIRVSPGSYSASTGESFPLNMKEGVSLLGDSKQTTILDGGNAATVVSANGITQGTLAGFTVTNGKAAEGAGIHMIDSSITIKDNIISQNNAGAGGGIYATGGSATISANQISENQAQMYGGGLYVTDFAGIIEHNIILNNQAVQGSGGGIYAVNLSGELTNNLIAKNVADSVGGIYAASFTTGSQLINNTIADNSATLTDSVGGMQASGVSSVLKNNIFWNNNNGDADDDLHGELEGSTITSLTEESIGISYSLINDYTGTNNNIYSNPLFVNPTANDYHLGAGSPAIDSGTTEEAPTLDLEGSSRPQGASTDMGAYEYAPPPVPTGKLIIKAEKDVDGKDNEPLADLLVRVYDKSESSCAAGIGTSWHYYSKIIADCTPDYSGTTNEDGMLEFDPITVGKYLIIGGDGTDKQLGTSVNIKEGDTAEKHLEQEVEDDGDEDDGDEDDGDEDDGDEDDGDEDDGDEDDGDEDDGDEDDEDDEKIGKNDEGEKRERRKTIKTRRGGRGRRR